MARFGLVPGDQNRLDHFLPVVYYSEPVIHHFLLVSAHVKQWVSSRSAHGDVTKGRKDMQLQLFKRRTSDSIES